MAVSQRKIDGAQFAAGKYWVRLSANYARAQETPRSIRSAALEPEGGTPPDPDSYKGRKQAEQEAQAIEDYEAALAILKRAPRPILAAVVAVCEQGQAPIGLVQLQFLRRGLSALAGERNGQ